LDRSNPDASILSFLPRVDNCTFALCTDIKGIAMTEHIIAGHKVKLYDGVDDMPIPRYSAFNRMMLIDSGIGGDIESVNDHIRTISMHIKRKDYESVAKELQNYQQNLHFIIQGLNPKMLAFAAMVASVDGEEVTDYSSENMQRIAKMLSEEKLSVITRMLSAFKKKIEEEIATFFPEMQNSATLSEYYTLMDKRTELLCDQILNEVNHSEEIERIELHMYALQLPEKFSGADGVEALSIKRFEEMCAVLSRHLSRNPKEMTVMEYYQSYMVLKEESKSYGSNTD
jgi:hypothetical protein